VPEGLGKGIPELRDGKATVDVVNVVQPRSSLLCTSLKDEMGYRLKAPSSFAVSHTFRIHVFGKDAHKGIGDVSQLDEGVGEPRDETALSFDVDVFRLGYIYPGALTFL